jgi:hypothetical protein
LSATRISATLAPRMALPRLFRRREVPVPTLAGWLVLLAIAALGSVALVRALFPLLAPVEPLGGDLLVVEGWGGSAVFDEAAARFRRGGYRQIVTTGGAIDIDSPYAAEETWAVYAADELRERGIDPASITVVAAPPAARERTYVSAVVLRERLEREGAPLARFDLVTRGPHGRRSRLLFQQAFGDDVEVGVVSVPSSEYDPAHWWASSEGVRSVVTEAVGMAWTLCCFDPGPRGSEPEEWRE